MPQPAAASPDPPARGARLRALLAKARQPVTTDWVRNWLANELTGDKIVDTEKFPIWTSTQGKLVALDLDDLREHLWQKYGDWVDARTGQPWTQSDFLARFEKIKTARSDAVDSAHPNAAKQGRYKLVADDYRDNVYHAASEWLRKFGIPQEQTLAIAIYSSSQYTPMNALSRGRTPRGQELGVGKVTDLWLIAKAGTAIRTLGKVQPWLSSATEVADPILSDQENQQAKDKLGARRVLRRDVELKDTDIDRLFLDPAYQLDPAPDPSNKGFMVPKVGAAYGKVLEAFRDLALLSTTTNLEGSAPFNEKSNVVLYVELYDGYAPFPAVSIRELSCYPKEDEILWAPGVSFVITKVRDQRQAALATRDKTWRKGCRLWSKTEKLEVYLRPQLSWESADLRYLDESGVKAWLRENMTGSKIVDTEEFKLWKHDSADTAPLEQKDDFRQNKDGVRDNLRTHLEDKYAYWFKRGLPRDLARTSPRFQTWMDAKWRAIVSADGPGRDRIVGEDYIHNINAVATSARRRFGLPMDRTLAIAIYSSAEYGKMNLLGRGDPGSAGWKADRVHLWLNAKTSVGIDRTGRNQKWVTTGTKPDLAQFVTLNGLVTGIRGQGVLPADFTPHLRRDEGDRYPAAKVDKIKSDFDEAKASGNDDHPGYFVKPNFLWSTTMKLDGVSPFNEQGKLSWVIDVTDASDEAAMNISELSAYPKEAEILWRYRQQFRIVACVDNRTKVGVEVKKQRMFVFVKALPFEPYLYPVAYDRATRSYRRA